jgi:AraC-like DNA-binding protein
MSSNTKKISAQRLQRAFYAKIGQNAAVFKMLFDSLPDVCFYMKDAEGRIMALNHRNCEVCNIADEREIIGKRSNEIFPPLLAEDYMSRDREVTRTGEPVISRVTPYPADRSTAFMVSTVSPLRDKHGKIAGTTCVYRLATPSGWRPDLYGHLHAATEWIDAHYTQNIPAEELARKVGVSVSQFNRLFRKVLGISPGVYLTNARLNAARKLLETTDMLITEIATQVGFWDHSHFIRAFRKARGKTPSQYRKQHWEGLVH